MMSWTKAILCGMCLLVYLSWTEFLLVCMTIVGRRAALFAGDRILVQGARQILKLTHAMLGLRYSTDAITDLPANFLVVANHQSLLDIPALVCAFPKHNLRFVAKQALRRGAPTISRLLRLQRHVLLDRSVGLRSIMAQIERLARRSVEPLCPVIFPEGTRSRDGAIGPFHRGIVHRLLETRPLAVVCTAIDGGHRLASLSNIVHAKSAPNYRLRMLRVYDPPNSREETDRLLEDSHTIIRRQLERWRTS